MSQFWGGHIVRAKMLEKAGDENVKKFLLTPEGEWVVSL